MQDYGSLGITSITDRKRLFQTLRYQQELNPIPSSPSNRDFSDDSSLAINAVSGMRTPQQPPSSRMRFPLKANMIGLSSVSYVKKIPTTTSTSSSKDYAPPSISTSMSSPRMGSSCRSPFTAKKNQLPVFIRKQQQQEEEEEEEDDREIVKNSNALLNPYGLPASSNNRHLSQKKSDLNQKIRVCVRKRPLAKKELEKCEKDITPVQGVRTVHVNEPKVKVDLTKYIEQHTFNFDDVFDVDSTNDYIYQRTAQPLVKYIFGGGKATCFAYGQTGSGKTYTMMDPQHGLYILAAQDIFNMLQQPEYGHLCAWIGFYEIYQGQLYDLLADRKKLFAREDGKHNVVIVGLKEYRIKNVSDLMQVFEYGNQVRSTGSTGANSDSSRSHAIMQVLLKPASAGKKKSVEPIGKLSFIDLAGSERGADRGETDLKTRMEGAEINKSLLALKECIRALDQDKKHTPFRQSKLTQVLKDSFVGNSRTCMIATVSPNQSNSEHTLNTLRYADRVKELKNGELSSSSSGTEQDQEEHLLIPSSSTMPNMMSVDQDALLSDDQDFSSLLDTDFPHEIMTASNASPPITPPQQFTHIKNQFNLSMIEDFISQHRNEIRTTNECSKKETRFLTNVSLGLTTDNRLKMSSEFIDYLSNLDDILDQKMAAIEHLKDRIRLVLNQAE
ncbi:hypothetical protein [Parasitella parasitica]|uniref:Kinesin-like protein n=1 Tax=Parasitella parasitica TaxID=35722 RepID=A0A0B7NJV4_9FUNG|nr:hypothetical protein [Parasitella parasitica]